MVPSGLVDLRRKATLPGSRLGQPKAALGNSRSADGKVFGGVSAVGSWAPRRRAGHDADGAQSRRSLPVAA